MPVTAESKLESNLDVQEPTGVELKSGEKTKDKPKNSELKRMTIALPADTARMLELLSELQGVSQTEALRRAISTEAFIQREIKDGSKVLIESPDNRLKELVFR
jgi:Ribbon-helix-helix protein, copG family